MPRLFLVLLLIVLPCCGCRNSESNSVPSATTAEPVDVACTAWPLTELVRELAGNELTIQMIEPESGLSWRNRRSWFPNDEQLAKLAGAKRVVENGPGVPYVGWIEMSAVAEDRVCNASLNFRLDDYIPVKDFQSVHSHGPEGEHSHDYMVPYCWHDPALAAKQANAIGRALSGAWPELDSQIQARAAALTEDLGRLATDLRAVGAFVSTDTELLLATPDLLFLARAMGRTPRYRLWFDEVDDATWVERIQAIQPSTDKFNRVVLLWPGDAPDIVKKTAGNTVTLIEIDMLESGGTEGTFRQRLARQVDRLRGVLNREQGKLESGQLVD